MLSTSEKRFIRYWQEQREGGRWSYYVTYMAVGTFMVTIIISTFLFLFLQVVFGSLTFWMGFLASLAIAVISTLASWSANEKKFRKLIRREIEEDSGRED